MASFKFKYEKVLQVRIDDEDKKKQELANAINYAEKVESHLKKIKNEKKMYDAKVLEDLKKGTSANKMRLYNSSKRWYRDEIEKYFELFILAKEKVSLARKALLKASQEVKKIEKLKEKAKQEYTEKEDKQMEELLDSVVNYQTAIKTKEF